MENDNQIEMTTEDAQKYKSKITYITMMGSRTKVSPKLLAYVPELYIPKPTEEEYAEKFMFRYFAKKSNDKNAPVIEVEQSSFENGVKMSPFYVGVRVPWQIAGSINDVYSEDGILQEAGVLNYNSIKVSQAEQESGIKLGLQNLLEFYKAD